MTMYRSIGHLRKDDFMNLSYVKKGIVLFVAVFVMASLGNVSICRAEDTTPPATASTYIDGLKLSSGVKNKKYSGDYRLYVKNIKRKYGIKDVSYEADASGEGIDRIRFTYDTTISYKMTKAFVKKVNNTKKSNRKMGNWYYAVVDDTTGKCIEGIKDSGVVVSSDGWAYTGYQKVKSGKYYCTVAMKASSVVDLYVSRDKVNEVSLVIGLSTVQQNTKADEAFWYGTKVFDKTSMYKKYSKYAKRIRLADLM